MKYMVLGVKIYKGCIINERGNRGSVTDNQMTIQSLKNPRNR